MIFFTKHKTIYIVFLLCMSMLTTLKAQNNYWNAQFTDMTTGAEVSVSDVCGGNAYQLCISPTINDANCGNSVGTCGNFTAEVRDFCNPNEPNLVYELVAMNMGVLASIWCGPIEIPPYMQPNACPDIRISAASDCCPNLNNPPVIEIPFTGSCNSGSCCETTLGGHYFSDVITGMDISESDLCGGTTIEFCTEVVYDATVCNDSIVPYECIIVTAEPRDYCNPNTLGNVQYLEPTTTGLWCGVFDLPEYTTINACPDIRVMTYNACCPGLPSIDVVEIPFEGSCDPNNTCCDTEIDIQNLFLDGTGGQNAICEAEPFFLCADIATNAACNDDCVLATVSLIHTTANGSIDFFILEANILVNNTSAVFCNDFMIPYGTMQAGIEYELRIDVMNTCCENPEVVASIPIVQSADCSNDFCCDAAFNGPYFSDSTGTDIPISDLCGGSTLQMCMTVTGSSIDPASNCADCINIFATARDYCNPNSPSETFVLDLIDIGNASNLYCANITLPAYDAPNSCPDIRITGSNNCCPFLDEFLIEVPFAPSCNTNPCCEGQIEIGNLNVSASATGTEGVCEEMPFNLCFDVFSNRMCNNEACLSANIELVGYTPNGIVSNIFLAQGILIDFGLLTTITWCQDLIIPAGSLQNGVNYELRLGIDDFCCGTEYIYETPLAISPDCVDNPCCEGEVIIENLAVYASLIGTDNTVCEEEPFNLCFDVFGNTMCNQEFCLSANVELIGYTPNGIVSTTLLTQGNIIDFGSLTTITWCQDLIIPAGSLQNGVNYELRLGIDDFCCEAEYIYEIPLATSPDCNDEMCCATDLGGHYFIDLVTGMDIPESDLCGGTTVEFCTEVLFDSATCADAAGSDCITVSAEVRDFCGPTDFVIFYDLLPTPTGLWCGTLELPEYTEANACPDIRVSVVNNCCINIAPIVTEIPFAGTCEPIDCCSGGYEISDLFLDGTGGTNELCLGESAWVCGFIESNHFCDATIPCLEMNIDLVVTNANGNQTILNLTTLPYFQFGPNNSVYQFCEQFDMPTGNLQANTTYEISLTINDMCCGDSFETSIPTFITDCSPACIPEQPSSLREENLSCNGVSVAWNAVPQAAQYQVAGRVFGGDWQILPPQTATTRTFNANTIQANMAYQWTVRAICEDGTMSNWVQPVRTFATPVCRDAISASSEVAKVSLHPNPAPQQTNIHLDIEMLDNGNNIMLKVYDMMGKTMIEQTYSANATAEMLNISALPIGVYIVELNNGKQKIIDKLMVK
ncbi:MAG: T9SS type A sorting domain-containing protein [Chitinophagales bacterium]